jgi:hypothetical protein
MVNQMLGVLAKTELFQAFVQRPGREAGLALGACVSRWEAEVFTLYLLDGNFVVCAFHNVAEAATAGVQLLGLQSLIPARLLQPFKRVLQMYCELLVATHKDAAVLLNTDLGVEVGPWWALLDNEL